MNAALTEQRHGSDCGCARCIGFPTGNTLAERHGAYADPSRFVGRVQELADAYRPHLPAWSPADEPLLKLFALTVIRTERAAAAIAELDQGTGSRELGGYLVPEYEKLGRLRQDLRSWIALAARLADQLGMSPTSRARLAGDLAVAQRTLTARSLREQYGADHEGAA